MALARLEDGDDEAVEEQHKNVFYRHGEDPEGHQKEPAAGGRGRRRGERNRKTD